MNPIKKAELRVQIPKDLKTTIEANTAGHHQTISKYVTDILSDALLTPSITNAELHDFVKLQGLQLRNTQEYLRVNHPEIHVPYLEKGLDIYDSYVNRQNNC